MYAPPAGRLVCLEPKGERKQEPHMTKGLGLMSLATGTLLLAAVSACGSNNAAIRRTSTATTSARRLPTTSASPTSPSDAAASDAEAAVRRYYSGSRRARSRTRPATCQDFAWSRRAPSSARCAPCFGSSTHVTSGRSDRLVIADTKRPVGEPGQLGSLGRQGPDSVIDVCWDVSKVDVVDSEWHVGHLPEPPGPWVDSVDRRELQHAADPRSGWRVASGQDIRQAPCAAS